MALEHAAAPPLFGEMYHRGMIKTWVRDRPEGWELASGAWSPFYFMFREVPFVPSLFRHSIDTLTNLVEELLKKDQVDVLVGIASTGIPLAAGVALELEMPLATTRKVAGIRTIADLGANSAAWGEHSLVEGRFEDGMRFLLVDDVVTGGASKLVAREMVEQEATRRSIALAYAGTVVVVDRGSPGLPTEVPSLTSGYRMYDHLDQLADFGATAHEIAVIQDYLAGPATYQDPTSRTERMGVLGG